MTIKQQSSRTPQWRSSASLLLVGLIFCIATFQADALFGGSQRPFVGSVVIKNGREMASQHHLLTAIPRGGSTLAMDNDDEDDDEEEDLDVKLTKSTIKSTNKAKKSVTKATKDVINTELTSKKYKKKSRSLIPYIIRASMNPFIMLQMVKGYWMSLFQLNYLKKQKDPSQELRTAAQEQAKKMPPKLGKRKMRPGQAKTLSDLPKLSA